MKMKIKKRMAKRALVTGPVLEAILGVEIIAGCTDGGISESDEERCGNLK